MKYLLLGCFLFSGICIAQTPSPQTPSSQEPETGLGKVGKSMNESADATADLITAIIKDQQGECILGDCQNSFGVSDLPKGGKFRGFYENGVGVGFSQITTSDNTREVFSNYVFGVGRSAGFMLVLGEEDMPYQFISYDTQEGIGFYPGSKKYGYFKLVDGIAQDAISIDPTGKDLGCVGGNCYDGAGVYRYNNRDTYTGLFKNGKPHGIGEMWYSKGVTYWGQFVNGIKKGQGIEVYGEDRYYYGDFKNDKRNGKGIDRIGDNEYKSGVWVNGILEGESSSSILTTAKPASSNNTKSSSSASQISNPLSANDQTSIKACRNDKDCLISSYTAHYKHLDDGSDQEIVMQKLADYLVGVDLISPDKTLGVIMAAYEVPMIIDYLPENLKARLRQEAQGIAVDYQKYINSEATKKAIEAKGGKMNKN